MRRLKTALVIALASATGVLAQPTIDRWGQRTGDYNGQFTFVRVRWTSGTFAQGVRGANNNFWIHEFPRAEQNLMAMVKRITRIDANSNGSLNLALDDPNFFKYPVTIMWEPGYWVMTDKQAERLREYLLKGGFVIFNDFELEQWENFEAQMRRVLPGERWVRLDKSHPIFNTFFHIEDPDIPHAAYHHLVGLTPEYYGLFEGNDPTKRLIAVANYNTNLAEYWQVAETGFFPLEPENNAFKLGINYIVYGLTH